MYIKTLKVARIAFGDEPGPSAALKLSGLRKQTVTGWFEQASTFYANLTAGFADRLVRFGYTPAKLAAEAALVEGVRQTLHSPGQGVGRSPAGHGRPGRPGRRPRHLGQRAAGASPGSPLPTNPSSWKSSGSGTQRAPGPRRRWSLPPKVHPPGLWTGLF